MAEEESSPGEGEEAAHEVNGEGAARKQEGESREAHSSSVRAARRSRWGGGSQEEASRSEWTEAGQESSASPDFSADPTTPEAHERRQRRETVPCPQSLVGRLIGKQGETIKDLQRRSGARIQIDQNFPEGHPRLVTIEGDAQSVQSGVELVTALIGNSPAAIGLAGNLATFECPKNLVGRVIGKGGETINELQRRSGARIQIEQRVPEGQPCIIELQGDEASVQEAIRLTQEVMSGRRLETAPGVLHPYQQQVMMQYPYYPGIPRPVQPAGYAYGPAYGQPPYPAVYAAGQPAAYAYGGWPLPYGQQQANAATPPASSAVRSDPWTSHSDGQGRTYWHNSITGESTWTPPRRH